MILPAVVASVCTSPWNKAIATGEFALPVQAQNVSLCRASCVDMGSKIVGLVAVFLETRNTVMSLTIVEPMSK